MTRILNCVNFPLMFSQIATIFFILVSQLGLSASAKDLLASALKPYMPAKEYVMAQTDGVQDSQVASDVISTLSPLPGKVGTDSTVFVDARAAIVMDAATKEVLFESDAHKQMAMASITKLMTALIVIERGNLNDAVAVKQADVIETGSDIDLRSGEQVLLGDLLRATLIKSANDAATAMGRHVGGTEEAFVKMMNEKAEELGLKDTRYMNPHGFDEVGHHSSAYDIALLMAHAMENKTFSDIVKMKECDVAILNSDRVSHVSTTNELLKADDPLIEGGKTGFTDEAGESVVLVAKNPAGHRIITVILDSPYRFAEGKRLIDFVYEKYQW